MSMSDERPPHSLSLWITLTDLQHVINDESDELKTTSFIPHVTVIPVPPELNGLIEVVEPLVRRIAQSTIPFEIEATDIATGNSFFQCIYLPVVDSPVSPDTTLTQSQTQTHSQTQTVKPHSADKTAPSPSSSRGPLSHLHHLCVKVLYDEPGHRFEGKVKPNPIYMPHISLVYGAAENLSEEVKAESVQRLTCRLSQHELSDSQNTKDKRRCVLYKASVRGVDLVSTPLDDVKAWKVVKTFPFAEMSE
eukprot:GHVN01052549.1.p1 GENE.GHVN01052549.1~~GHVN01052549.1.p1  ORF type:complete len:249 (-),score=79.88 GHVN01052549.1:4323-5069(-)